MAKRKATTKKPDVDTFITGSSQTKRGGPKLRLNADIPADLHRRIRIEAAKQGKSVTQILQELIEKNCPDV